MQYAAKHLIHALLIAVTVAGAAHALPAHANAGIKSPVVCVVDDGCTDRRQQR
jgi:hypothetical protein